MRLFLAINLPPETKRAIAEVIAALRAAAPSLSWVDDHHVHLTLKFLGDVADGRLDALTAALGAVAARHAEILVELGGLGAFPNFRRARTVWLGVIPQPRLELLHHDIELAFADLGFSIEGRPFRPHLTLARVQHANEAMLRALSRAAKTVDYQDEVLVRSVDLMRSDLLPSGARHTLLASASLRST